MFADRYTSLTKYRVDLISFFFFYRQTCRRANIVQYKRKDIRVKAVCYMLLALFLVSFSISSSILIVSPLIIVSS